MAKSEIICGDALEVLRELPAGLARCCVTSPPYWGLRDYGVDGQIGLERTPEEYAAKLVEIMGEVRRVLADDGTLWLNLGDSYSSTSAAAQGVNGCMAGRAVVGARESLPSKQSGLKPKDLVGIPWRVAFALQADGWYLRSDIIWSKPNPMPESVTDRPTKAHEYLFLLSKSPRYYYDAKAIAERTERIQGARPFGGAGNGKQNMDRTDYMYQGDTGSRNRRSVWEIATQPFPEAHFAVMPEALAEPCILAGSAPGDTVLDPFSGAGTTGLVALRALRRFVGIELNPTYAEMARLRLAPLEVQEEMF